MSAVSVRLGLLQCCGSGGGRPAGCSGVVAGWDLIANKKPGGGTAADGLPLLTALSAGWDVCMLYWGGGCLGPRRQW